LCPLQEVPSRGPKYLSRTGFKIEGVHTKWFLHGVPSRGSSIGAIHFGAPGDTIIRSTPMGPPQWVPSMVFPSGGSMQEVHSIGSPIRGPQKKSHLAVPSRGTLQLVPFAGSPTGIAPKWNLFRSRVQEIPTSGPPNGSPLVCIYKGAKPGDPSGCTLQCVPSICSFNWGPIQVVTILGPVQEVPSWGQIQGVLYRGPIKRVRSRSPMQGVQPKGNPPIGPL
jgi:hypothetical protein